MRCSCTREQAGATETRLAGVKRLYEMQPIKLLPVARIVPRSSLELVEIGRKWLVCAKFYYFFGQAANGFCDVLNRQIPAPRCIGTTYNSRNTPDCDIIKERPILSGALWRLKTKLWTDTSQRKLWIKLRAPKSKTC